MAARGADQKPGCGPTFPAGQSPRSFSQQFASRAGGNQRFLFCDGGAWPARSACVLNCVVWEGGEWTLDESNLPVIGTKLAIPYI